MSELVFYSDIELFLYENCLLNLYLTGFAEIIEDNNETNSYANMERGWASLIAPAVNLLGGLFGSTNRMFSIQSFWIKIH